LGGNGCSDHSPKQTALASGDVLCTSYDAATADSNWETCHIRACICKKVGGSKIGVPECNGASLLVVYLLLMSSGRSRLERPSSQFVWAIKVYSSLVCFLVKYLGPSRTHVMVLTLSSVLEDLVRRGIPLLVSLSPCPSPSMSDVLPGGQYQVERLFTLVALIA
jgi:hypothetical protein